MMRIFRYIVCAAVLLLFKQAEGEVRLPGILGNGMVLQRDRPISIWGWADIGEKVSVRFHKQQKTTKAGKDGQWKIALAPEDAGGPYQMIVEGENKIVLRDILVGEVWVCSGQSNMEFAVGSSLNAAEEIKNADYPQIRHFEVPKGMAREPQSDLVKSAEWKVCNAANVARFTAVGYFYARELHKQLKVPVGLIHTSWGGTDIETWISAAAIEKSSLLVNRQGSAGKETNLAQLIEQRKRQIAESVRRIQGQLPGPSTTQKWADPAFNDSDWPTIGIPGLWEQSIENFDGIVWFRKSIEISPSEAGQPAVLELGRIDDSDETYVNGVRVGGLKDKYNDKRVYPVSAGVLKAGKNVIVVKVEDNGGGGGIYGIPEEIKMTVNNRVYSLSSEWKFQIESVFESSGMIIGKPNDYPTLLFNAMVNPVVRFSIRGAIWYQGENNAGRAYQYRTTFPLLINDWRNHWGQGNFPFYFVQLASWKAANGNSNTGSSWAELREAQYLTSSVPNTGMAVAIDIGDRDDIHPKNKQEVGRRLAAIALNKTYHRQNPFSGPVLDTAIIKGNKVILKFGNASSGLLVKDKYGYIRGFEVAGADKKFYYAKASFEGADVVVSHDDVPQPIAVRYAWADDAGDANLYNREDFPAIPFRTDDWDGITKNVKYSIR